MVTSVRDFNIDGWFPAAAADGYVLKSDSDPDYNCIAWAANVTTIIWWPYPFPTQGAYWPDGVPRKPDIPSFTQAFGKLGYFPCGSDCSLERRYEKVALYIGHDGDVCHAARQLADGDWTSKIGGYRDIHHTTPEGLADLPNKISKYGKVVCYLKRERKPEHKPLRTPDTLDAVPPDAFLSSGCLIGPFARRT